MNRRASSVAKGIGILMMFCHHLFYSADLVARKAGETAVVYSPFTRHEIIMLAQGCKACVAVFVFVTGYGMFMQVSRLRDKDRSSEGLLTYVLHHHVRLILAFWVIFLVGASFGALSGVRPLTSVYGGHGKAKALFYIVVDLCGLSKAFGTPTYNNTWWYMSLAIALIYIVPILTLLARRVGSLPLLVLVCVCPMLLGLSMNDTIPRYLPPAVLGMVIAQYDLFGRKVDRGKVRSVLCIGVLVLLLLAMMYARKHVDQKWLFEALSAAVVCRMACSIERLGGRALDFVGRHSSNMFMCHTFIYSTFFSRQIYSLTYWWAILAGLLLASLAVSVAIEWLKRRMGFERLVEHACEWVSAPFVSMESLPSA